LEYNSLDIISKYFLGEILSLVKSDTVKGIFLKGKKYTENSLRRGRNYQQGCWLAKKGRSVKCYEPRNLNVIFVL
jgi:hypothetical protein